jgi:hypothetical protein
MHIMVGNVVNAAHLLRFRLAVCAAITTLRQYVVHAHLPILQPIVQTALPITMLSLIRVAYVSAALKQHLLYIAAIALGLLI